MYLPNVSNSDHKKDYIFNVKLLNYSLKGPIIVAALPTITVNLRVLVGSAEASLLLCCATLKSYVPFPFPHRFIFFFLLVVILFSLL